MFQLLVTSLYSAYVTNDEHKKANHRSEKATGKQRK